MLPLEIDQRFNQAIKSGSPEAEVYRLAVALKEEGVTQRELYDYFMEAFRRLPSDVDDHTYDAIADAIDGIVGAGSNEDFWIFGRQLSD